MYLETKPWRPRYNYYDTPEGQDIHKKLWYTTKWSGAAGLVASTVDVMLVSHPKGYLNTLGRYAYFTGPFVGMAAAFTVTSNLLVGTRNKNDRWNYFWGGCASGVVLGAWKRNLMTGFLGCLAFGIAGALKKQSKEEGWEFFPDNLYMREFGSLRGVRHDWTLTKDRPGNWTTGKE